MIRDVELRVVVLELELEGMQNDTRSKNVWLPE